jgi:miniconductance mechanosensitive channel
MNVETLTKWLESLELSPMYSHYGGWFLALLYLGALALGSNLIAKRLINHVIHPLFHKSKITWDDLLVKNRIIIRCSHLVPAAVIQIFSPIVLGRDTTMSQIVNTANELYLIIITLFVIDGALNFIQAVWEKTKLGERFHIKGFLQALKIIINLIGLIFILAVLLGKSPLVLLSGLGAVTAIILLVFKDSILGLVAGIQLSLNDMIRVGDWIEIPSHGADGDVIDVSLTTVKVQNWDKTITTIPTYSLIAGSFKNWRGMSAAKARRIKRSVWIDMNQIKFVDASLLKRFQKIRLLVPYLESTLAEIQKHNEDIGEDLTELINGRRLTNIGTFRAYCAAYLKNHPEINQEMTVLVRQLSPTKSGLPIEIYVFTQDTEWLKYEGVQADIFDHLLSILPEFELAVYQSPSGADLRNTQTNTAPFLEGNA